MGTLTIIATVILLIALGALLGRMLFNWLLKIGAITEIKDKEKED